jgi:3-dehydroquinate dehydratase/shikimate dehydrogenase
MTTALLCETVTATTMAELRAGRDTATTGDMVELRLDGIADVDVAGALAGRTRPVIVTCRPQWEGGRFDGSEDERRSLLRRALELGAEFVDLEWGAGFDDVLAIDRTRIVLSTHDFGGVPADVVSRARAMRATGAGVIKIAVLAERLADTLPLLDIARDGNAVVIGMGDAGAPTRLLAARFGSKWSYAGNGIAPGQIVARRMVEEFRFREIGATTRVFGVLGTNALHSASPAMHNAAFAAAALDAVYVPLRAADFDDFLTFADRLGVEGASVTIPFKLDAFQAARSSDQLTRAIGAANTLRRRGAEWDATNTDVDGFLAPLESAFAGPLQGARAAVLGAGGAARAVVVALLSRGMTVTVHARRDDQAREVTAALPGEARAGSGAWPPPAGSWDLLVNCTPLGGGALRGESPLPDGPFDGRLVYDLTYGAGDSRLIEQARAAGCRTLDGLPMLIAQAERQFEWWTGDRPAAGVMADAAGRRLGRTICA